MSGGNHQRTSRASLDCSYGSHRAAVADLIDASSSAPLGGVGPLFSDGENPRSRAATKRNARVAGLGSPLRTPLSPTFSVSSPLGCLPGQNVPLDLPDLALAPPVTSQASPRAGWPDRSSPFLDRSSSSIFATDSRASSAAKRLKTGPHPRDGCLPPLLVRSASASTTVSVPSPLAAAAAPATSTLVRLSDVQETSGPLVVPEPPSLGRLGPLPTTDQSPLPPPVVPPSPTKSAAATPSPQASVSPPRLDLRALMEAARPKPAVQPVLRSFNLRGIARYIREHDCRNIVVLTGAGVSVSAGIPDFRSPGTGLYDNLERYNLPSPESVFDIDFFMHNPRPFYSLARDLYPGRYEPTPAHYFVRMLQDEGRLLRNYTQNIDGLERLAGIKPARLVEAHGSFASASCVTCNRRFDPARTREVIFAGKIPRCHACKGCIKPDIVFFGQDLPNRFYSMVTEDFPRADLLIVMGTSLSVQPFAGLINYVGNDVPRLLINLHPVCVARRPLTMDEYVDKFGSHLAAHVESDQEDEASPAALPAPAPARVLDADGDDSMTETGASASPDTTLINGSPSASPPLSPRPIPDTKARRLPPREVLQSMLDKLNKQRTSGFAFWLDTNRRDVAYLGTCDRGVKALARALGLEHRLATLIKSRGAACSGDLPRIADSLAAAAAIAASAAASPEATPQATPQRSPTSSVVPSPSPPSSPTVGGV